MGICLEEFQVPEENDPTPLYRFGIETHNLYVRAVWSGILEDDEGKYIETLREWHDQLLEKWALLGQSDELNRQRIEIADRFLRELSSCFDDATNPG